MTDPSFRDAAGHLSFAAGCVVACGAVSAAIFPHAELEDVAMVHVLGIVACGIRLPFAWSIAAGTACIVSFDFFFVPPAWAFALGDLKRSLTLVGMLVVSLVVSSLTRQTQEQARIAAEAAARERAQSRAAESERIRSSILSSISHDLKTPLAAIVAAGTTLARSRERLPGAEFDLLLDAIVTESERLSRILQNLVSITRLESPTVAVKLSPEAVDEVLAAALGRLTARLAPSRVEVDVPDDLPLVAAEPALLEQVFCNLFENVARYAPPESPVEIVARRHEGSVRVSVLDRGPGIPPEHRERVFEKFERGPAARTDDGGMGLGLTICRAIMNAHGGKISVGPRPGGGAVFTVDLPIHPPGPGGVEGPA